MGNIKEKEPIRRPIKALFVDDQVEDLYLPHKWSLEKEMEGEIEFVSSAKEALEILEKQAQNGSLPDIIVTDLYMPEMSGFEFIKTVRSHHNSRLNSLPFCVMAVLLEDSEKSQLKELGVKMILDKGLIVYDSYQIRRAWEESQEKEPIPKLIRILWVDDEAFERIELNKLLLKGLNGEIECVLSAKKALEILERKAKDGTLPDLVISDFNMPNMNGLQFVEAVRNHQDERIRSLPVCIVSGLVPVADEYKLKELGISVFNFEDAFHRAEKIRQICEESK